MGKIIVLSLLLFGCADNIRIRSEVQETFVPVLYCPAPEEYTRPILSVTTLTDTQLQNPGEIAKHYQATIEQLIGYSRQLELELQKYDSSNEAYKDLQQSMQHKFIEDGVATEEFINQNK